MSGKDLSGVGLARVALQAALASARKNGGPCNEAKVTRRTHPSLSPWDWAKRSAPSSPNEPWGMPAAAARGTTGCCVPAPPRRPQQHQPGRRRRPLSVPGQVTWAVSAALSQRASEDRRGTNTVLPTRACGSTQPSPAADYSFPGGEGIQLGTDAPGLEDAIGLSHGHFCMRLKSFRRCLVRSGRGQRAAARLRPCRRQ